MTKIQETGDKVLANVERVIVGKHHEVRRLLEAVGHPRCRGDKMATNPRWRQPLGFFGEHREVSIV